MFFRLGQRTESWTKFVPNYFSFIEDAPATIEISSRELRAFRSWEAGPTLATKSTKTKVSERISLQTRLKRNSRVLTKKNFSSNQILIRLPLYRPQRRVMTTLPMLDPRTKQAYRLPESMYTKQARLATLAKTTSVFWTVWQLGTSVLYERSLSLNWNSCGLFSPPAVATERIEEEVPMHRLLRSKREPKVHGLNYSRCKSYQSTFSEPTQGLKDPKLLDDA